MTEDREQEVVQRIERFEDTPEFHAYEQRYANLFSEGNPYFIIHDSPLTDTSLMAGKRVLNFGSYNYAGMSGRPEVSEAAIEAIRKYGTSASGSRLLAGEKSIDQELEREIADWKHTEDALVEGVYSMDGDVSPVPEFVKIKKEFGCFLMVDEAHSTCVIGETGGGVDEYYHLAPDDIDIKMGTLSKGLGACGGYLAGSRNLIEYMRYMLPGFVFSVGISPPLAAAALKSIQLVRHDPSVMGNLRRNIQCFMTEARKYNLDTCLAGQTAILPVLVGKETDAMVLSNAMREAGVFVPPAIYPAVPQGAR